ncbi:MAG TPA: hypothetical protein VKB50_18140 [Vicinamibacterales bacterium]|nr:hypothetical protein [Vicinamibacterales bacterium]
MNRIRLAIALACLATAVPAAQWLRQPTPGIPRTTDGKPDLSAPVPRTPEGKPDLSGLWQPAAMLIGDLAANLPRGSVPFQPWAEKLYNERRANNNRDDPTANCIVGGVPRSDAVPYPFKVLHMGDLVVILYEAVHSYRQIFADGRSLPTDPNPTWFGYSVGRWDKDTFVVETAGFNDKGWLDNFGKPATERLRVTERFVRKDFGHMDVLITIDDPGAYTKPWDVTLPLVLRPDTELLEYICNENNRYFEIIPKLDKPRS